MNAVRIAVNDRTKRLSVMETLTTGSTYAVSVDGGAATCGASAMLTVASPDGTELAAATLANGAGTLALDSQAVADCIAGMPFGAALQWHMLIRSLDEGEQQNVAVGHVTVVAAQYPRPNPNAGQVAFLGPKGDPGAAGKDAYEIAVDKGYEGSRTAWLASLKGETGPAGTIGYVKDKDADKWYALYVTTNQRGEKVLALSQTETETVPSAGEFTGRAELAATEASEAQVAAEAAQAAAEGAAAQAAIDAAAAAAESAATAAAAAIAQPVADAAASAENAEAWANGTRDDEPVDDEDPAHQNNAKYFAEQASGSATDAAAAAGDSADSAEDAEAWANGTRNGTNVGSTDPAYNKHAKHFADAAADSATDAAASATAADGSADDAAAAVTAFTTGNVTISGTKTFTGTVNMQGAVNADGESLVTVPTQMVPATEDEVDTEVSDETAASTQFVHAVVAEELGQVGDLSLSMTVVQVAVTALTLAAKATSGVQTVTVEDVPTGFEPIGVVGLTTGNAWLVSYVHRIVDDGGTKKLQYAVLNAHASASKRGTPRYDILCAKVSEETPTSLLSAGNGEE